MDYIVCFERDSTGEFSEVNVQAFEDHADLRYIGFGNEDWQMIQIVAPPIYGMRGSETCPYDGFSRSHLLEPQYTSRTFYYNYYRDGVLLLTMREIRTDNKFIYIYQRVKTPSEIAVEEMLKEEGMLKKPIPRPEDIYYERTYMLKDMWENSLRHPDFRHLDDNVQHVNYPSIQKLFKADKPPPESREVVEHNRIAMAEGLPKEDRIIIGTRMLMCNQQVGLFRGSKRNIALTADRLWDHLWLKRGCEVDWYNGKSLPFVDTRTDETHSLSVGSVATSQDNLGILLQSGIEPVPIIMGWQMVDGKRRAVVLEQKGDSYDTTLWDEQKSDQLFSLMASRRALVIEKEVSGLREWKHDEHLETADPAGP